MDRRLVLGELPVGNIRPLGEISSVFKFDEHAHHQHDLPPQRSRRHPILLHALHRPIHQSPSPLLLHDRHQLLLAIQPDMALQAHEHRPSTVVHRRADRSARVAEGDVLRQRVPVCDFWPIVGGPDVDFDAAGAGAEDVGVGLGRGFPQSWWFRR